MSTKNEPIIQEVAEVIGLMVSSLPGVIHGKLFYRSLEIDKITALRKSQGNFQGQMPLSQGAISDLKWWINNIEMAYKPISHHQPSITLYSDASKQGGAVLDDNRTGGRWTEIESSQHINELELLAAFFALKSLCSTMKDLHIAIYIDNTTAVAYINAMGGTHSLECNNIAKEIWQWCIDHNIWLTAISLPGKENVDADRESRVFNDNTEWTLQKHLFNKIVKAFGKPSIDLFASRLNKQVPRYISWKPDPEALHVNAFTYSWSNEYFYAFPPFSQIMECLQKIEREEGEGMMVLPIWTTQPWYPKVLRLLADHPRLLPTSSDVLFLPRRPDQTHPLGKKLKLMACKLSGNKLKTKEFLQKLPESSLNPGEQELVSSTSHTIRNGLTSVIKNKLVHSHPL